MSTGSRLTRRALTLSGGLALALTVAGCSPAGSGGDTSTSTASGEVKTYPTKSVTVLVPAATGGGWDSTARSLQEVITSAKITDQSVEVVNREGGGGATGLAQLTGQNKGNPDTLMIGGLVMIGALSQAESPLKITDATPIATLTSETEAFVTRKGSKYPDMKSVIAAYKADPKSVTFGGGSAGGSDHIVIGMALKAAGLDPSQMKYIGYAGGGEATAGILSGDVEVGVSGLSEFVGQVGGGKMSLLAVSSDDAPEVAGAKAPTLQDAGVDVDFVNWRAIFAPPGISADDKASITAFVDKIHTSQEWKDTLTKRGWSDDYRTGQDAQDFIQKESDSITQTLKDLGL